MEHFFASFNPLYSSICASRARETKSGNYFSFESKIYTRSLLLFFLVWFFNSKHTQECAFALLLGRGSVSPAFRLVTTPLSLSSCIELACTRGNTTAISLSRVQHRGVLARINAPSKTNDLLGWLKLRYRGCFRVANGSAVRTQRRESREEGGRRGTG